MFFLFQPTGRAWNSCDRWPVDVFALSYLALSTDYFVRENLSVSLWREIQFSSVTGTCGNFFCPYILFVFCYFPRLLNNFFFQRNSGFFVWLVCLHGCRADSVFALHTFLHCLLITQLLNLVACLMLVSTCTLPILWSLLLLSLMVIAIVVIDGDCCRWYCYYCYLLTYLPLFLLAVVVIDFSLTSRLSFYNTWTLFQLLFDPVVLCYSCSCWWCH